MAGEKRELAISVEAVSGTINRFYAFVNDQKVIAEDGQDGGQWTGPVDDRAEIKVRVFGAGKAKYKLTIDLPGTADDQELELTLTGGYHELELVV
jgi:HSP20 family molecular chaperone IbpA